MMRVSFLRSAGNVFAGACLALLLVGTVSAQDAPEALGGFGNSRDPIRIDAQNLEVIENEQKAIYSGDVVVVQGPSTLRCATLTIFYTRGGGEAGQNPAPAGAGGVRRVECAGPISAVNGTSTLTGDNGNYVAETQLVTVTGNVILTDCNAVQRGDVLTYNMNTRVAKVTGKRVQGIFEPGREGERQGACE
jgi:lipopolysaccharide export system protein LptA